MHKSSENVKASHRNASEMPGPKIHPIGPSPTHPAVPQVMETEVNRAITASGNMNKHRGDRRDMSTMYTNNQRHAARGNTPRADVSTRKR